MAGSLRDRLNRSICRIEPCSGRRLIVTLARSVVRPYGGLDRFRHHTPMSSTHQQFGAHFRPASSRVAMVRRNLPFVRMSELCKNIPCKHRSVAVRCVGAIAQQDRAFSGCNGIEKRTVCSILRTHFGNVSSPIFLVRDDETHPEQRRGGTKHRVSLPGHIDAVPVCATDSCGTNDHEADLSNKA